MNVFVKIIELEKRGGSVTVMAALHEVGFCRCMTGVIERNFK